MVDLTSLAFDLGDIYRMPVMIMGDGALGQMMEPISFDKVEKLDVPEKTWASHGNTDEAETQHCKLALHHAGRA